MSLRTAWTFSPRLALRVWQREVTLYKRIWPSTILSTLFDPIVYLLALGFGLGSYLTQEFNGVSYLQFIAPGLVASSVMMAAAYETAWNSYVRIHQERSYEAMLTTPAALTDVVAGEILWATTRSVLYACVMLGVLAGFGLVRSWWALAVPFAAFLGGLTFAAIGLTYTALVRHMEQLTFYFTLFITPMYLFSGIFFPLDRLPAVVQGIAWLMPLHHLVEVARALVLGEPTWAVAGHLLWLASAFALFFGMPSLVLRRKLLA